MMTTESSKKTLNGWPVLAGLVLMGLLNGCLVYWCIREESVPILVGAVLLILLWGFLLAGFFTLQPNVAAVLLLFGAYKGTSRDIGFRWANPLFSKKKVSLRAHNLNGDVIKVNDKRGNPVQIAVVVVWRVADTAEATFDVEDYSEYVNVQSESAVRHLASRYPYDTQSESSDHEGRSLRGSIDEVSKDLQAELAERLSKAGVTVDEARISHLAYAPEIAGAMLRRQQAEAIVAARTRIVDGAVGMVEMALNKLDENKTVVLDEERRASMVSNLLVVLCGEREASPVINAGSLYT